MASQSIKDLMRIASDLMIKTAEVSGTRADRFEQATQTTLLTAIAKTLIEINDKLDRRP